MIYIAHEPRGAGIDLTPLYDYAKAEGHEVSFVFSANYNVGQHPQELMAVAETFAAGFDFGRDLFAIVGGDPLAGVFCALALAHEARPISATEFQSLRYVRERDGTGRRTIPRYIPITIPTGV